jgi:hypothetical protein
MNQTGDHVLVQHLRGNLVDTVFAIAGSDGSPILFKNIGKTGVGHQVNKDKKTALEACALEIEKLF